MKVLITGGAGFIGSHLTELFLEQGHEVFIIDNLSTGSLENLESFRMKKDYYDRCHIVVDTIMNHDRMLELVGICDVVFHLAAAVGVQYIIQHPLESIVTNVRGTDIVLEICDKFKKKVLIASTSEVYGKHEHSPLVETDDCVYGASEKSRWSYAAAKLIDEFSSLAFHRERKLQVIIVRLFNIVGPKQTGRYGMVLPRFVEQALKGEPITVYGDGSQTRTFTHVFEVVHLFQKLIETPKAIGEIMNIGGVEEISIIDLAKKVKTMTESNSPIQLVPYETAFPVGFEDMLRRVPSTEKLKKILGSIPNQDLESILRDVIAHTKIKLAITDPVTSHKKVA